MKLKIIISNYKSIINLNIIYKNLDSTMNEAT